MSKSEGKNPVLQPIPLSAILDPTYSAPFSKLEKFQVDMEIPEVQVHKSSHSHHHHPHLQSSSSPSCSSMWQTLQFTSAAMGSSQKNHSSPRASELAGLKSPVHYWDVQIGSFSTGFQGPQQCFQNSDLQQTLVNAIPNFVIISQPVLTTRTRAPSSSCTDDDDDIVFSYSSSVPEELFLDGDVFQSQGADQTDFLKPTDSQATKKKKVSFNEEKLASVLEFEDDQDLKATRETYWEMLARDRCRFQDRICRTEDILQPILCPGHRAKVFKERFQDEEN